METIYTILQQLQLDFIEAMITGLVLFAIGFWVGSIKSRKFLRKIRQMEKEIMDLNSELLYNDRPAKKLVKTRQAH